MPVPHKPASPPPPEPDPLCLGARQCRMPSTQSSWQVPCGPALHSPPTPPRTSARRLHWRLPAGCAHLEDRACTTLASCGHTCLAPHQSTRNEPPANCRGKLPLPTGNPGVAHARQGSWTGLKTTLCAVGALRAFPRAAEKSNAQGRPERGRGPKLWRVWALGLAGYAAAGPARNKATNVTETTRETQIQTGQWRPVRNAPESDRRWPRGPGNTQPLPVTG